MKKIKFYICSIIAMSIVSGCSLDEEPNGFLSSNNFYKTETDANAAMVYAYAILPEIEYYSREFVTLTEVPTENLSIKPDGGVSNFELDNLNVTPSNTDIAVVWQSCFIGVNRASAIVANVPKILSMAEADRNQVTGEGHFLRALHYFNLVRLFGSVPLHKEPISSLDQVSLPKSPIADIYAFIIDDLKQASDLMGTAKLANRANKTAAWALLSKVYLHLASSKASGSDGYDFVSDANEMYANAATYAGKVLNEQSNFAFEPNILNIWGVKNENGPEHIFSASTDKTGAAEGNYSKLPLMFIPALSGPFKLPGGEDGKDSVLIAVGWNHFITESGIYNSYKPNDKRKTNLIASTVFFKNKPTNLGITDYSRPFSRKYLDPDREGDKTSVNTPILRYSDIMLVFAEASGPTAEAYDAVNQIRQRAGLSDLTPGLDATTFRDSVLVERSWEFAFEGNRLFDLRRTNSMKKVLVDQYGKTITSGEFFFPIPQSEVDLNPYID
jgi:hypothetical protein